LVSALRAHVETLKGDVVRLEGELASARTNADRATIELKTNISRLTAELGIERAARRTDQEQQLAVARAAADRGTAELVELARRLAEMAEKQTAETAEAESEPPRRTTVGRAWRWFLRN
jgi:hypothetical protein